MAWRVVDLGRKDPALTAAMDEAILTFRSSGKVGNTISFYSRDRPTVSLGYFEKASECIDVELCRKLGIEVVRRLSGGSAIFTDPGQIIYTVTVSSDLVPESPKESYPLICGGVVNALRSLGIAAEHRPLNDVVVNGRKISGSAQTRKAGVVLQHGTIIVDSDIDLMMRVIRQRPGKARRVPWLYALRFASPLNERRMSARKDFERTLRPGPVRARRTGTPLAAVWIAATQRKTQRLCS